MLISMSTWWFQYFRNNAVSRVQGQVCWTLFGESSIVWLLLKCLTLDTELHWRHFQCQCLSSHSGSSLCSDCYWSGSKRFTFKCRILNEHLLCISAGGEGVSKHISRTKNISWISAFLVYGQGIIKPTNLGTPIHDSTAFIIGWVMQMHVYVK